MLTRPSSVRLLAAAVLLSPVAWAAPAPSVVVQDKVPDKYAPVPFGDQRLTAGTLAERMRVNLEQRLLKVDEQALLSGFVKRPGSHPWIGEHAGKFLHAAANTYAYTRDARLRALADRIASTLIASQLPDGYLGTYTDDQRWTSWDVWSHKYNLIGLLAWYDVTGDDRALAACRKIGNLLCRTFGDDAPDKKDLSLAGTHMGMAATSVLEPMCSLYRRTGDRQYLDFCHYITRSIEKHSKVISSLSAGKGVHETANRKAYEMLSNLVGLVELYRLTGDQAFLKPAANAWADVVDNDHLFLTGTTSTYEHFDPPGHLPAGIADDVGEGCVTTTWLQLNLSLLRLTGEAKYADQIERTIYNQLLAAQHPTTGDICYFTPMIGPKPYRNDVNCCLSSEPRGISLIPQAVWGVVGNDLVLNLAAPGEASVTLKGDDGQPVAVKVRSETDFPHTGRVKLTFDAPRPVRAALLVRQPSWCPKVEGADGKPGQYARVPLDLASPGKQVTLTFDIPTRSVAGGKSYPTSIAVQRGPQVLALDPAANPNLPVPTSATVTEIDSVQPADDGGYTFRGACTVPDRDRNQLVVADTLLKLVPFADASAPLVWLPAAKEKLLTGPLSVTFGGKQSVSRTGNRQGSITDLLPDTLTVTFDRKAAAEDWFAVELPRPAAVRKVVFRHGHTFHDGGWFNASAGGKPRVQVRPVSGGRWQTVATLDAYPDTTATDAKGLKDGQAFEAELRAPIEATAVRVIGKPATGDRPKQAFSSCSELAAYADGAAAPAVGEASP